MRLWQKSPRDQPIRTWRSCMTPLTSSTQRIPLQISPSMHGPVPISSHQQTSWHCLSHPTHVIALWSIAIDSSHDRKIFASRQTTPYVSHQQILQPIQDPHLLIPISIFHRMMIYPFTFAAIPTHLLLLKSETDFLPKGSCVMKVYHNFLRIAGT